MSLRREFVELALVDGANKSELCRRFEVSRRTAYKWLNRYKAMGLSALADRSRRPRRFRRPTADDIERAVVAVRARHPAWGGRKIAARLKMDGLEGVPQPSTITGILHRHHLIDPEESAKRKELIRFERARANDLWQMDFKGEFKLNNGRWCYPLTVLDDHSRYSLGVRACGDQKGATVREHLTDMFRLYGMPWEMLMDHGKPWYTAHSWGGWTKLGVWLLRLDVGLTHGRVRHPQTQGKDERFNRTFKAELKPGPWLLDLRDAQGKFDPWRDSYNCERPHEALGMRPPSSRYVISERAYPEVLPEIEYGLLDEVRSVNPVGQFSFQGRLCKTSEAFNGERIALRPTVWDGVWQVYYSRHRIGWLDLRGNEAGAHGAGVMPRRPEDLLPPEADAADIAAD